jgi:glycosyltransferase involved in cell wall biosynthesis
MRVLHVLGSMNRGGVETWLMDILRNVDRQRIQMDFLLHTCAKGAFDDEIAALGSRVISCPGTRRPGVYACRFLRRVSAYGPYDVVHSHVHLYSGLVLALAASAGIKHRIAHSHNDTAAREAAGAGYRKAYAALMKAGIRRYATMGLAASGRAADALFGPDWRRDPRWRLLYYGIDVQKFLPQCSRKQLKERAGLPPGSRVVAHIGRFDPQKNHPFMVDIAKEVIRRDSRVHFVFVGDGPLRPTIERSCEARNIRAHCHFLGIRSDVPEILGCADAFLFPSLYEGLGLVLIEAQAAGVPCIYSDVVPKEADVTPHLITKLPLSEGALAWGESLLAILSLPARPAFHGSGSPVEQSAFTIQKSVAALTDCYLLA